MHKMFKCVSVLGCMCIRRFVRSKVAADVLAFFPSLSFSLTFPLQEKVDPIYWSKTPRVFSLKNTTNYTSSLRLLSFTWNLFFLFVTFAATAVVVVSWKKNWNPNKDITQLLKLIFSLLIVAWEKKTIKKIKCMISSRNSWTYFSYIKKTRIDQFRECAGW